MGVAYQGMGQRLLAVRVVLGAVTVSLAIVAAGPWPGLNILSVLGPLPSATAVPLLELDASWRRRPRDVRLMDGPQAVEAGVPSPVIGTSSAVKIQSFAHCVTRSRCFGRLHDGKSGRSLGCRSKGDRRSRSFRSAECSKEFHMHAQSPSPRDAPSRPLPQGLSF